MPIDIYFFNSLAQFLALALLMTVIFVLRKSVGSHAMLIGFELLLLTVLLRRVDEIGLYLGLDVFDRTALAILSWIVILVLTIALVQVWRRRVAIRHIAEMLRQRENYSETLRRNGDDLQAWNTGHRTR